MRVDFYAISVNITILHYTLNKHKNVWLFTQRK